MTTDQMQAVITAIKAGHTDDQHIATSVGIARMGTVDAMIADSLLEPAEAFNRYRPTSVASAYLAEKDRKRAERIAKRLARKAA